MESLMGETDCRICISSKNFTISKILVSCNVEGGQHKREVDSETNLNKWQPALFLTNIPVKERFDAVVKN